MLITAFAVTVLAGLMLAIIGWRGRRVGEEPVCRRCGFDLRGKPESSTRCAECGSDLQVPRAVVRGQRVRRRGWVATGLVIAVLMALPLSWFGYFAVTNLDPYVYYPLWYLERQINLPTPDTRAEREITNRIRGSALTGKALESLLARAVDRQTDPGKSWHGGYEEIIQEGAKVVALTPSQVERLFNHTFTDRVEFKSRLRQENISRSEQGVIHKQPLRRWEWEVVYRRSDVVVGQAVLIQKMEALKHYLITSRSASIPTPPLPVGRYTATYDAAFEVHITSPFVTKPTAFTQHVKLPLEILPADAIADDLVMDAAEEPRIKRAMPEAILSRLADFYVLQVRATALPYDVAGEVWWEQDGKQALVGSFH